MTFALNLIAVSGAEIEWLRPVVIGWVAIVLALSMIEIWLTGSFSSRRVSKVTTSRSD